MSGCCLSEVEQSTVVNDETIHNQSKKLPNCQDSEDKSGCFTFTVALSKTKLTEVTDVCIKQKITSVTLVGRIFLNYTLLCSSFNTSQYLYIN